jgi:hypothetical protein
MNASSSWYSVWRPGYLAISVMRIRTNVRKKDWCANLNSQFDVPAVKHHIGKGLLHVCPEDGSIGEDDTEGKLSDLRGATDLF